MGKKRVDHHQQHQTNDLQQQQQQQPDHHHHHQDQGKKRSSEESILLHKLNTHLKKLSKARSRISPSSLDSVSRGSDKEAAVAVAMHACNNYGSPSCSSSSTRVFDVNDDNDHRRQAGIFSSVSAAVVAFKFGQLDYCCSGESESVTMSYFVATDNEDLFGGENTFAPDLNAAHNLMPHVDFPEDKGGHVRFGAGTGAGYYLTDPIGFFDGFAKYSSESLKLSTQEDMIQEFFKNNLFD